MVPEELLFWLAPLEGTNQRGGVLCKRHADSMVVPRGWTLDDRRNGGPRLFQAERFAAPAVAPAAPARARSRRRSGEQLQIDGTGEIPRPAELPPEPATLAAPEPVAEVAQTAADDAGLPGPPWRPEFDTDDDLGGVMNVTSPLLARAFRGTGLPR